jgi:proline dehydrogenase
MKQLVGSRSSDWLISGRTALATTQARINTSAQDKAVSASVGTEDAANKISFNDPREAYISKKTSEIFRAYFVLTLCGIRPLVENNDKLMKLGQKLLGKALFGALMKQTFYGHFVAGEDKEKIKPIISRMQSFGVKSILDYSVEEDMADNKEKEKGVEARKTAPEAQSTEHKQLAQYTAIDESEHKEVDRKHKLNSARVYFYQDEANCDRNMQTFLDCIDAVKGSTGGTGFSAIKLTALGRPEILIRLSDCIEKTRDQTQQVTGKKGMVIKGNVNRDSFQDIFKAKNIQTADVDKFLENMVGDNEGVIHLFNWSSLIDQGKQLGDVFQVPNLETGKMEPLITGDDDGALTKDEEVQFRNMVNRLHKIFTYAREQNVRVMIDAEQSYFQPAIHRLAIEMMRTYNKDRAIVFNTYQCYLKKAHKTIVLDLEQAKRQNFYFGAKLVRGAYMEQERARAALLGYKDPINANYEATSDMYHKVLDECLTRIHALKTSGADPQRVGIMVASHNADTVKFGVRRMSELDLDPQERVLCFAQLLGMCDQITFPLGQAGYSVYKYVPYGPVNEVLPYLSRRANENGSMLAKVSAEKNLLGKELLRRIVALQWFYKPKGSFVPVGFK